jgi:hypothetical protein
MVLYGKTAALNKPVPPLQACIMHCCRASGTSDVSKLNLDQIPPGAACSGATPQDPFPELTSLAGPELLSAARAERGATVTRLGLTRLAGRRHVR